MEKLMLEKCGLFHTPSSMEALMQWIESLNGGERAVAMTAAMMSWNLASDTVEDYLRRQALGHDEPAVEFATEKQAGE